MSAFIKDPRHLLKQLRLPDSRSVWTESPFPLKVPVSFVERMHSGDPDDPLLRQILPVDEERRAAPGYKQDAVGDLSARPAPGILHKYAGRALIMLSPRCDIHCRFCFRRHFPYEETLGEAAWRQTLDYLRRHTEIHEIILSGGDPFALSEPQLLKRCQTLEEALPHVRTLRIHSRTPIAAPERTPTGPWLQWLAQSRLKAVLVTHCNHPQELNDQTAQVAKHYWEAGVHLLNQTVLLKGVNDCEQTLEALSHKLFSQRILPYYLHMLDRVEGTAHFEVSERRARELIQYLRDRLPGYLVPRLVRETPGEPSKTPIG